MPTSLQSRARVVIGDDNDTTLQTISRIVRVQFDVVGTVRDGETAVNSIELLKPDVLFSMYSCQPLMGSKLYGGSKLRITASGRNSDRARGPSLC